MNRCCRDALNAAADELRAAQERFAATDTDRCTSDPCAVCTFGEDVETVIQRLSEGARAAEGEDQATEPDPQGCDCAELWQEQQPPEWHEVHQWSQPRRLDLGGYESHCLLPGCRATRSGALGVEP